MTVSAALIMVLATRAFGPSMPRPCPNALLSICRPSAKVHVMLQERVNTDVARSPSDLSESEALPDSRVEAVAPLPSAVNTICAFVFCQMLSEGIAISSLPLHLTRLGASAVQVGTATSCFSLAQMVFSPTVIAIAYYVLSNAKMLRLCLFGASLSSWVISLASTTKGVIVGRTLAGLFAASVPVAQAAVAYIVPSHMTARALGRVSAFAQLGVIIGPAASGALQFFFGTVGGWLGLGLGPETFARLTFATSGLAAFYVALTSSATTAMIEEKETDVFRSQRVAELRATAAKRREERAAKRQQEEFNPPPMPPMLRQRPRTPIDDEAAAVEERASEEASPAASLPSRAATMVRVAREKLTQPSLRLMAMTVGFGLTLSVSTYSLLGDRFFGYGQSQLSAVFSAGAAITILVQLLLFPRLVDLFGENLTASSGLLALSAGLSGLALFRAQPFHLMFYLLNRAGSAVADTSTVTRT